MKERSLAAWQALRSYSAINKKRSRYAAALSYVLFRITLPGG